MTVDMPNSKNALELASARRPSYKVVLVRYSSPIQPTSLRVDKVSQRKYEVENLKVCYQGTEECDTLNGIVFHSKPTLQNGSWMNKPHAANVTLGSFRQASSTWAWTSSASGLNKKGSNKVEGRRLVQIGVAKSSTNHVSGTKCLSITDYMRRIADGIAIYSFHDEGIFFFQFLHHGWDWDGDIILDSGTVFWKDGSFRNFWNNGIFLGILFFKDTTANNKTRATTRVNQLHVIHKNDNQYYATVCFLRKGSTRDLSDVPFGCWRLSASIAECIRGARRKCSSSFILKAWAWS